MEEQQHCHTNLLEAQQHQQKNHMKKLEVVSAIAQWVQKRQAFQQDIAATQMTTIYEEFSPGHHSSGRRDEVGPPKTKKIKIEPMNDAPCKLYPDKNKRTTTLQATTPATTDTRC